MRWSTIQALPDKPWNYIGISRNPNITSDIVLANPDKEWDYAKIVKRMNNPWTFPIWSAVGMSERADLTWKMVRDNMDKDWYWKSIMPRCVERTQRKIAIYFGRKWRFIARRRKNRHKVDFIHVLDHLKLYVRDKMAGTLRR